jgi:putative transposase
MPYWRTYFHLVWSTHNRLPAIAPEMEDPVQRVIRSVAKEHHVLVHAIGIMPDHVHVAVSIPPAISVSALVGKMKVSSSHFINNLDFRETEARFRWQSEFGVYTFSEKALPDVIEYVTHQRERHASRELWRSFEITQEALQPASAGFVG